MAPPGDTAAAIAFIRRVKKYPQLFGRFCRVMKDFSTKKLDVTIVVSELETLFQSHEDLLSGYRILLPPEIRQSSPSLPSRNSNVISLDIDMDELEFCINFMNNLQKRFAEEQGVILAYMKTIRALKKGELSYKDAYGIIAVIFGDQNQDLVYQFDSFLGKKKKKKTGKENSNLSSTDEMYQEMEDHMFEVDIDLCQLRTTLESASKLMKLFEDSAAEEQKPQIININDYFSPISISCIRKEYKAQGRLIIQILREYPKSILPEILSQLKLKEQDLIESKEKLNEYWRETLKNSTRIHHEKVVKIRNV